MSLDSYYTLVEIDICAIGDGDDSVTIGNTPYRDKVMVVEGAVLNNVALLELSRAVSSERNLVLHVKWNLQKEIAFRQI